MRRIAITGGIAEGKSTVLGCLASLGFQTFSADAASREAFQEPDMQLRLAALLGKQGPVTPEAIRAELIRRPAFRREINSLMHPKIKERIATSGAQFFEVPLLIETCMQGTFDEVWVVTCGPEEQMRRLTARLGASDAVRLVGAQLSTLAKIPFADFVIRTNRPEDHVLAEVRALASLTSV